ncbi:MULTISPECIES: AraC family transcriptional regulator [unclassified Methylobacterium]|uniref:helix-turn-helix domain-containing protein n=1 Tax=unclassified Methylobacterium TaxID=2615210 RepID=UPI00226AD1E6|nr:MULTISPECIES: AraC family transcriptional regulator [unclassified Methylobacterium]
MSELGRMVGRVGLTASTPVTYLHTSAHSGWSGAALTHVAASRQGVFEGSWRTLVLSYRTSPEAVLCVPGARGRMRRSETRVQVWQPHETVRGCWDGDGEAINLFIEPRLFEEALGRPVTFGALKGVAAFQRDGALVGALMRSLLADSLGGSRSGPMLGESILGALVQHVSEAAGMQPEEVLLRNAETRKVRRARDFIEANLAARVGLTEISREVSMSVRHLRRAFHLETGMSPHQYLIHRRVELAKRLMADGRLTLEQVALRTGFVGSSHFSTTFRKVVGVAPSQFRNM